MEIEALDLGRLFLSDIFRFKIEKSFSLRFSHCRNGKGGRIRPREYLSARNAAECIDCARQPRDCVSFRLTDESRRDHA